MGKKLSNSKTDSWYNLSVLQSVAIKSTGNLPFFFSILFFYATIFSHRTTPQIKILLSKSSVQFPALNNLDPSAILEPLVAILDFAN